MSSLFRISAIALSAFLLGAAASCGSGTSEATPEANATLPDGGDASTSRPEPGSDAGEPTKDGGAPVTSFDAGPKPTSRILPVPGEVTIIQLDLPPGLTLRIGESAIVVGPNGTI